MSGAGWVRIGLIPAPLDPCFLAAGLLGSGLGALVMAGWHLSIEVLIRPIEALTQMQYNAAVAALLCGSSIVASALGHPVKGVVAAAATLALGLATLAQDTLAVDLGIDSLLMSSPLEAPSPHPGRMAPNAASSFVLLGAALLLQAPWLRFRWCLSLAGVLGTLVLAISALAFVGFVSGLPQVYAWQDRQPIAPQAVFAVAVLGLGVLAGLKARADEGQFGREWMPLSVGSGGLLAILILWQGLIHAKRAHAAQDLDLDTIAHALGLFGGILFVSLLAVTVFLAQAGRRRTRALELANGELRHKVDELARAQKALRRSESRYRRLLESGVIGIAEGKTTGEITAANDAYLQIVGYSREDLASGGMRWDLLTPPEYMDQTRESLDNIRRGGVISPMQKQYIRKDGSRVPVLVAVAMLEGSHDDGIVLVLDMTEIKAAEQAARERDEALRANERMLRTILESLPVGVFVTDERGRIFQANPAGQQIWAGVKYLGVERYGEYKAWWADSGQRITAEEWALARAVTRGETLMDEVIDIECFDGTRKTILNSALPLRDEEQRITGAVAVIQDITARRHAEQALERESGLVRLLQSAAVAANEAASVEDAARRMLAEICNHSGWLVGHLYRLASDESGELVSSGVWHDRGLASYPELKEVSEATHFHGGVGLPGRVLKTGLPEWICDVAESICFDRREAVLSLGLRSWMGLPVLAGGKAAAVLEFFSTEPLEPDARLLEVMGLIGTQLGRVVERTRAAQVLTRYASELERSNKDLQEFAVVASHDLQEPLRKIVAFGDRLKARGAAQLDEQNRDYVERMQSAAARMTSLLESLLELSRVTTRAQPFVLTDLRAVLEEVLSDLEERLRSSGGRVEVGALPVLHADRTQMRRLFQNLIGNALKFHKPDEPPLVTVAADRQPDGQWQLHVKDNGIGFEEQYLDRIFKPFQRLHGRGEFEGTGMGLAIASKIVHRHGGKLTAFSTPCAGSTFVVQLPPRPFQQGD